MEPLLGGVYAGHAREISARAAVPRLVALLDAYRDYLLALGDPSAGENRLQELRTAQHQLVLREIVAVCARFGRMPADLPPHPAFHLNQRVAY